MKVVSLFSGAGGFDLGMCWAGHQIVWANDNYLDAAQTYERNLAHPVDTRDMSEVPSGDIPACDVVIGGFPCQGFSVANWGRSHSDPRNALYLEMVRVVENKQPRYFIGENVKGMLSLNKGAAISRIVQDFARAGYAVRYAVLNSADYGVPQLRQRLIILGVRSDIVDYPSFPPLPTHADPGRSKLAGLKPWRSARDALKHFPNPSDGNTVPNHEYSRYKLRFNGHLGHRVVHPDRPAPTATGRGDDKGGVVVLHHPNNRRRMTARELAAIQSFPDDFVFCGTKTSAYRQIANALPPLLARAIGSILSPATSMGVDNASSTSDTGATKAI